MVNETTDSIQDPGLLSSLLEAWRGKRVYIVPTTDTKGRELGNHGDLLMELVTLKILASKSILVVQEPSKADFIAVRPGGALIDIYAYPQLLKQHLAILPDLPLIILPSSAMFRQYDPVTIFNGRKSPTIWILREEVSFNHLKAKWSESLGPAGVQLILDHDVIFSGRRYVHDIMSKFAGDVSEKRELLVVSRLDAESRSLPIQPAKQGGVRRLAISAYWKLPTSIRRRIRSRKTAVRQAEANQKLMDTLPAGLSLPHISANSRDISDPNLLSFGSYAQSILEAEVIVTNRLHVALPGTVLGKQTFLVDSGYHKLRGVYERSLRQYSNITLVSNRTDE